MKCKDFTIRFDVKDLAIPNCTRHVATWNHNGVKHEVSSPAIMDDDLPWVKLSYLKDFADTVSRQIL